MGEVMLWSALAILIVMLSTWAISVAIRNASIVDIVWGLGFVVVGWVARATADGDDARQWLLTVMVSVWGLRLAGYLAWRNIGHGEDYRYKNMRKHWGAKFPVVSLITVFGLQGTLMWIVSLPFSWVSRMPRPMSVRWRSLARWCISSDSSSRWSVMLNWRASRPIPPMRER